MSDKDSQDFLMDEDSLVTRPVLRTRKARKVFPMGDIRNPAYKSATRLGIKNT